jgi:hypothetical protein
MIWNRTGMAVGELEVLLMVGFDVD